MAAAPSLRFREQDVVAFIDLQNLHHFLKECGVQDTKVNVPGLISGWAASHGLPLTQIRAYTGIHDAQREPQKYEAMSRRLRWLESKGVHVTALPLSYYRDRKTGEVRAQEKGVDVRLASELLEAVGEGLTRAVMVTQDKDLSQALEVARSVAHRLGRQFLAYSPTITDLPREPTGICGTRGIAESTRLAMPLELVQQHVRPDRS